MRNGRESTFRAKHVIFTNDFSRGTQKITVRRLKTIDFDLRNKFLLSYLFITHDLQVVRDLADRVIVMKSGKIIEQGNVNDVFNNPNDEYTKDLLKASLSIDKLIK